MTDFYSRNDVNYNGDVYSIPFPYIKEKEIQVFLDDTLFEDWFFLNDSQIKLRNIPQEVTSNTIVSVRRVTDIDKKVVTYTNNTLLNKENLNLSQDQLLYAVQEIYDNNIQNNIDIRAEVDEKVERVSDAVEQLEALNDAVETAVNASAVAGEKAEIVIQKEEEINQTITQATQEIEQTYQTALEEINQQAGLEKAEIDNLSEDLKDSIKDLKVLTTLEIGDIGIAPLGIDETKGKRRYLNGQLIIQDQYVQFTNKVKSAVALYPSLACTESEWQTTATMTVGGQVGKFVVDDEGGTIRLPKIIMPIQGLTDLSKLGEIVEAGLPTHTHTRGTMNITGQTDGGFSKWNASGAFYNTGQTHDSFGSGASGFNIQNFDASRSWTGSTSTGNYSKALATADTVQQEQIQYPYFIQVATGAEVEDNIVNEIELNNPFSLLDYKYSEYELNNISWLRSNGQYNSKITYPAVYDLLLKIYNGTETKAGVSVKLSTETFTDYDFVLNTTDETFRLPIKVKQKFYNAVSGNFPVVGTGKTLGLDDGTGTVALGYAGGDLKQLRLYREGVGASIGTSVSTIVGNDKKSYGVTTDSSKSGLIAKLSSTEVSGLYLYFYVGETVQNANLINAGRIEEKLVDKVDTNASNFTADGKSLISGWGMPSSKYIDLTLGASGSTYIAPANGYFNFGGGSTSGNKYAEMSNNGLITGGVTISGVRNINLVLHVKRGDIIGVTYTTNTANSLKFFYAEGEVS